jgi:Mg-chelatase subunit ChlD
MITLDAPLWLLLLVPGGALLWQFRPRQRALMALRALLLVLLVIAMAGPRLRLPSRAGTVVAIVDRSLSMPPGAEATEKEVIDLMQKAMSVNDRLAVVAFGERALVERAPDVGRFAGFVQDVGPEASNLTDALESALALLPAGAPGRVVVVSDGRWTGRDPAQVAGQAAGRGVAIDYRALARPTANDLAIVRIDAPPSVAPGQSFVVTAWVQSPVAQDISFEFSRGDATLAAGTTPVPAGLSRLLLGDRADTPGTRAYVLSVHSSRGSPPAAGAPATMPAAVANPQPDPDPVPENNTARLLVGVDAPRRLLVVSPTRTSALADLLHAGGLAIERATPADCEWSLERLSNYSAVVLENIPAQDLTQRGMETLATYTRETGCGLMITGGRSSFGPGGYYKSPLEPIMPVSMELRREHRKLALDIVVALDRSGSMALPAGPGRVKMDLANLGTVAVMDLLSPMDALGVIAVDTQPHIIADLAPVTDKEAIRRRVLSINSEGGGIYIYVALKAAAHMIATGSAATRHIVLFSDAADAEEPADYGPLVDKLHAAGVTVSVIGLGTEKDKDANLLKDIARRGGGRVFFSADAAELPRIFAQDTFVVARSAFITDPTPVQLTPDLTTLAGKSFGDPPPIGGYNLCYLRPNAGLGALTRDEYKAPVVAAWQAGLGRVLCYTGEADGRNTGAIARWRDTGEFFTSLARWTAGAGRRLPGHMLVTQELHDGNLAVRLQLDPERDLPTLAALPQVTILKARADAPPGVQNMTMRWTAADELAADVPLIGGETAVATVHLPTPRGAEGAPAITLCPVCPPYSPEYVPATADAGLATLQALAHSTGGVDRTDWAGIWRDLPRQPRAVAIAPWLIFPAMLLLLGEVLERRTGLLSMLPWPIPASVRRRARASTPLPAAPGQPLRSAPTPRPEHAAVAPAPAAEEAPVAPEQLLGDALKQARQRAKDRTKPS